MLLSIITLEHDNKSSKTKNTNIYNAFIDFLRKNQINNDIINNLGEFCTDLSNDFSFIPVTLERQYILFCKVKGIKEIDYTKNMILVYEKENKVTYYDLLNKKELDNYSIIKKKDYLNYYFIIGHWLENEIINLDEEKEI